MGRTLAGTGRADFLHPITKELIMSVKVPTDQTLNASVSEEVNRGGFANIRLGSYFHDSDLALTITSATFDKQYLASKLGSTIEANANGFYVEQVTVTATNTITVSEKTPIAFFDGDPKVYGWYKPYGASDDAYKVFEFNGTSATVTGLSVDDVLCVKYAYLDPSGSHFKINAELIPSILVCVLTYPELKGDTKDKTDSSIVGEMTVTVPEYQFDPNTELSVTSTAIATVDLSGHALPQEGTGCDQKAWYARIDETIYGGDEYTDVTGIYINGGATELGVGDTEQLEVDRVFKLKPISKVTDYSTLTFTSSTPATATVSASGLITAVATGTTTISVHVTADPKLEDTINVTVS